MNYYQKKIKPNLRRIINELGDRKHCSTKDRSTDLWYIISDKYDLEIDGVNTTRENKTATMYLWADRDTIIKELYDIPQEDVVFVIKAIRAFTKKINPKRYDKKYLDLGSLVRPHHFTSRKEFKEYLADEIENYKDM